MCATIDPADHPRHVPPGRYPAWDRALALLNRDLAATLPRVEPLRLLALPPYEEDEPEHVHVAMANGEWHGNHLDAESQDSPDAALARVADAAQETVVELLWQAWPLCPEHGLGMHPAEDAEERLFWWCSGGGPSHFHVPVGALDAL
ncbi:hypothetical protein GTW71_10855 [Streptomyces sp. SID6041]|nr:hypothetical protein [Streptomyces sp. SID6041]